MEDKAPHAVVECGKCRTEIDLGPHPEYRIGTIVSCTKASCDGRLFLCGGEALGANILKGPYPDMNVLH